LFSSAHLSFPNKGQTFRLILKKPNPAYKTGEGPVVFVDEGHHNFHTIEGRYKPFSKLLERDGYIIQAHKGEFSRESLAKSKILVIANAVNEINADSNNWVLPNPSANNGSKRICARKVVPQNQIQTRRLRKSNF